MNVFWLDTNFAKCAEYHCDKHVVKMCVEYAQLLSGACRFTGLDCGYRFTHVNHPCSIWVRDSLANWIALRCLALELGKEFTFRYGKVHKSIEVVKTLPIPKLENKGLTRIPLCMPDIYKTSDFVESYRNYYIGDKRDIARWDYCRTPEWYK